MEGRAPLDSAATEPWARKAATSADGRKTFQRERFFKRRQPFQEGGREAGPICKAGELQEALESSLRPLHKSMLTQTAQACKTNEARRVSPQLLETPSEGEPPASRSL